MRYGVTLLRRTGLLAAFLTLCACRSAPVILTCPEISESITRACEPAPRDLVENLDLARAYLDERQCRIELNLRMEAVRAMAGCRAKELPLVTR